MNNKLIKMITEKDIDKAIELLEQGEIIIYPSESCYGIGCDARNEKAVIKLHKIKQEGLKPLSILISKIEQIKEFGILNETALKLIKLMPCQLNLIIDKKDKEKFDFLSKDGISFRIPSSELLIQLCEKFPITTTSANIHGNPSLYDIEEVKKQFSGKVSMILDAGNLNKDIQVSTIFDTRNNKIIRDGQVSKEEIFKQLRE